MASQKGVTVLVEHKHHKATGHRAGDDAEEPHLIDQQRSAGTGCDQSTAPPGSAGLQGLGRGHAGLQGEFKGAGDVQGRRVCAEVQDAWDACRMVGFPGFHVSHPRSAAPHPHAGGLCLTSSPPSRSCRPRSAGPEPGSRRTWRARPACRPAGRSRRCNGSVGRSQSWGQRASRGSAGIAAPGEEWWRGGTQGLTRRSSPWSHWWRWPVPWWGPPQAAAPG